MTANSLHLRYNHIDAIEHSANIRGGTNDQFIVRIDRKPLAQILRPVRKCVSAEQDAH
jgi:hypothetical protein